MKIDEALKLSDVAVSTLGTCVTKSNRHDWYHCGGHTGAYSLYELAGKFPNDNWHPAYICPQFQVGEKVSFLQACLSGQCFRFGSQRTWRCNDLIRGLLEYFSCENASWSADHPMFVGQNTTVTIVADPSQEQSAPKKRQRTHAEIVADIKTLVSELEEVK